MKHWLKGNRKDATWTVLIELSDDMNVQGRLNLPFSYETHFILQFTFPYSTCCTQHHMLLAHFITPCMLS